MSGPGPPWSSLRPTPRGGISRGDGRSGTVHRNAHASPVAQIVRRIDHHDAAVHEPTRDLDPAPEIAAEGHRLEPRRRIGTYRHDLRRAVTDHNPCGGPAGRRAPPPRAAVPTRAPGSTLRAVITPANGATTRS